MGSRPLLICRSDSPGLRKIDCRGLESRRGQLEFLHAFGDDNVDSYRVAAREFVATECFDRFAIGVILDQFGQMVRERTGVNG